MGLSRLGATPWVGALATLVGLALAALSAVMDRRQSPSTTVAADASADLAHV